MRNWKKILIGAGISGGFIAGVSYFFRLKRTSVELESVSTAEIYDVNLKGLTIRVNTILKNPTKTSFKIKFPYVKLLYHDSMIGSSEVVDRDITLPAYGEAKIEKIMIQIPIRGLFSVTAGLVNSLVSGESVKMNVKTISTIDLGWKQIPYEKTDEVVLKK